MGTFRLGHIEPLQISKLSNTAASVQEGTGTLSHLEITKQILLNTVGLINFVLEVAHLIPFSITGLIPEIPDFGIRYRFAMSALFPSRNLAQKLSYAWCRRHPSKPFKNPSKPLQRDRFRNASETLLGSGGSAAGMKVLTRRLFLQGLEKYPSFQKSGAHGGTVFKKSAAGLPH